jgi:hypothetical protein
MSLAQLLDSHYTNKNRGKNHRQIVLPQGAAGGVACQGVLCQVGGALTYGAWVDVAIPALITTDMLVVGVALDTPNVNLAADITTVAIGSTLCTVAGVTTNYANAAAVIAAGALAIAAAWRAELRYEFVTDAGAFTPITMEYPILVPQGTGILARIYDVANVGAPDSLRVSVFLVHDFEGRMT